MVLFYNINNKLIAESTQQKQKVVLDEIDELSNTIQANMHKEITVPKDVLNSFKIKDSLNTDIWEGNKLSDKVRVKLIKIAEDFFKDLEIPSKISIKDIIFTGSLANFNWSKFSDIDLHIVIDFKEFDADKKLIEDFFYAQKAIWNQEHDITVFKYPVELYVQDVNHEMVTTAIYSVLKDKWLLKPKREEFKVDKKAIKDKADKIIHQLKDIRDAYKDDEYQIVVDKVKSLKDKIKQMRSAGLEQGGEFSLENLVFKVLRRTPFMDQLDSFKAKSYDKLMSVTETLNENIMKELIRKRLKEAYGDKPRFIPYDDKSELRMHAHTSFSKNNSKEAIERIKAKVESKIENAIEKVNGYINTYKKTKVTVNSKDENGKKIIIDVDVSTYLSNPKMGNGFFQVAIYQNGNIKSGHVSSAGNMDQPKGPITDTGSCYVGAEHEAFYCKVAAGITAIGNNETNAIGASPADDAANKALVIFEEEIMGFLTSSDYTSDPEKAAELSAQKMAPKPSATKEKKDLEKKLGGPISDAEWNNYRDNGVMPNPRPKKAPLSIEPQTPSGAERKAQRDAEQLAKRLARKNK